MALERGFYGCDDGSVHLGCDFVGVVDAHVDESGCGEGTDVFLVGECSGDAAHVGAALEAVSDAEPVLRDDV